MMRLSTSRPKRSVPSGWAGSPRSIQMGGISFAVMSPSVGLCGASTGANTAHTTSARRIVPANQGRSGLPARMANPRVQVAVEDVDAKISREVERAQHEHAGLDDRVVARGDGFQDEPPEPRPREHRFGDDGAAEKLHEEHD